VLWFFLFHVTTKSLTVRPASQRCAGARGIHRALISGRLVIGKGRPSATQENFMRKLAIAMSTGLLVAALGAPTANAQTIRSEAGAHPRIVQAIHDLEDAVAYMENAPDNFGGHKAAAISASRAALAELRASLAFRAGQDRR
jgi:hypothetical protein